MFHFAHQNVITAHFFRVHACRLIGTRIQMKLLMKLNTGRNYWEKFMCQQYFSVVAHPH